MIDLRLRTALIELAAATAVDLCPPRVLETPQAPADREPWIVLGAMIVLGAVWAALAVMT